jgi:hypothetical protein
MPIEETSKIPPPEIPTKCIFRNIEVEINCTIKYIDFEGRSDGRSIKKIVARVNPRKMVSISFNLSLSLSVFLFLLSDLIYVQCLFFCTFRF